MFPSFYWLQNLSLLSIIIALPIICDVSFGQEETRPKIFFTSGLNQPLNREVELSALSLENDFYVCELVIEAKLILQGDAVPVNSVLLQASYLVLPKGYPTPNLLIGADKLMETGLPGIRYSTSVILEKTCRMQRSQFTQSSEIPAYPPGQSIEIEFSRSGLGAQYWSDFILDTDCTWLKSSSTDEKFYLIGTVPKNFSGCEGKVSTAISIVPFEIKFAIKPQRELDFPLAYETGSASLMQLFAECMSESEWISSGMDFLAKKRTYNGVPCANCHLNGAGLFLVDENESRMFQMYQEVKPILMTLINLSKRDGKVYFEPGLSLGKPHNLHPDYIWTDKDSKPIENFLFQMKDNFGRDICVQRSAEYRATKMNSR